MKGGLKNHSEPGGLSSALSASRVNEGNKVMMQKSNQSKLIGTSIDLEKPYLRLTTFPKRENVRPLHVLKKSLAHIKSRFMETEDFEWANEQLKSVRQDITVQHIRNTFVLEVYETHGRILLEHGDLNEFHQCQTMIRNLTSPTSSLEVDDTVEENDVKGSHSFGGNQHDEYILAQTEETADEFQSYGILYNLVQSSWGDMTRSLKIAADTSDPATAKSSNGGRRVVLRGSSVRHALQVVKAVTHNNYHAFFRLYESAPHLSAYLMDFLVRRVRKAAYERIIAAYRPTISIEHFREALCFQKLKESRKFLRKNGAIFVAEKAGPPILIDCKASFMSMMSRKQR